MLSAEDIQALWLTLGLAAVTATILLLLCTPLAWLLVNRRGWYWMLLESVLSLPLVLPPTVLGFYLLVAFSPHSSLGHAWQTLFGTTLAFSFSGLVFASVIYSLPFTLQPILGSFRQMGTQSIKLGTNLGASYWQRLSGIILPLNRRGLLSGLSLAFAHTLGEFGVVLLVGGSIPGSTRVLSIALFEHVEANEYAQAQVLAAVLLVLSLLLLIGINLLQRPAAWEQNRA